MMQKQTSRRGYTAFAFAVIVLSLALLGAGAFRAAKAYILYAQVPPLVNISGANLFEMAKNFLSSFAGMAVCMAVPAVFALLMHVLRLKKLRKDRQIAKQQSFDHSDEQTQNFRKAAVLFENVSGAQEPLGAEPFVPEAVNAENLTDNDETGAQPQPAYRAEDFAPPEAKVVDEFEDTAPLPQPLQGEPSEFAETSKEIGVFEAVAAIQKPQEDGAGEKPLYERLFEEFTAGNQK